MRIGNVQTLFSGTVAKGDGTASVSFECDRQKAERILGTVIPVNVGNERIDCLITSANDIGVTTGMSQVSGVSVVQHALTLQYNGTSTTPPNQIITGRAQQSGYSGVMYGDVNTNTREVTPISVTTLISRLFSAMQGDFAQMYGASIDVQFEGDISSTIDYLEWRGDSLGELVDRCLSKERHIVKRIEGNTLKIIKVSWDNVDRWIHASEIVNDYNVSLQLENSTSQILVESPWVSKYDENKALTTAKVYGLPLRYNEAGMEFSVTDTAPVTPVTVYATVDGLRSLMLTDGAHGSITAKITGAYDSRILRNTGLQGRAYERFGWRRYQVIIDETLGKQDGGTGSFDKTSEMGQLATRMVNDMQRLLWVGSLQTLPTVRVDVGDIVRVPSIPDTCVVVGVQYNIESPNVSVTLGTLEGGAFDAVPALTRLDMESAQAYKPAEQQRQVADHKYGIRRVRHISGAQTRGLSRKFRTFSIPITSRRAYAGGLPSAPTAMGTPSTEGQTATGGGGGGRRQAPQKEKTPYEVERYSKMRDKYGKLAGIQDTQAEFEKLKGKEGRSKEEQARFAELGKQRAGLTTGEQKQLQTLEKAKGQAQAAQVKAAPKGKEGAEKAAEQPKKRDPWKMPEAKMRGAPMPNMEPAKMSGEERAPMAPAKMKGEEMPEVKPAFPSEKPVTQMDRATDSLKHEHVSDNQRASRQFKEAGKRREKSSKQPKKGSKK